MSEGPIELYQLPTQVNFDPFWYLFANDDVAAAAAASQDPFAFARQHFETWGIQDQRKQLMTALLPAVTKARSSKLERLYERTPGTRSRIEPIVSRLGDLDLEMFRVRDEVRLPVEAERVSAHDYDLAMQTWFDESPSCLFLDVGAGSRPLYRRNVVYAEIAALPSTDLLCFADDLPFDDNVFDGVIALAVLEHVPNPLDVAAELVRVVRPGCPVIVDWPFLVPVHGYPEHFFNATPQGARYAFERLPEVCSVESSVPSFLHPAYVLRWMLDIWAQALGEDQRAEFEQLRIAEILAEDPEVLEMKSWARMAPEQRALISAGTRIVATKAPSQLREVHSSHVGSQYGTIH